MNRPRQVLFSLVVCLLLASAAMIQPPIFPASQATQEQPLLTFAVMSDSHVVSGLSQTAYLTQAKFAHALDDISPLHPNFLVINGDLGNGTPDDYAVLKSIYTQHANFPLYPTMGNHEYYYQYMNNQWNDSRAKELFKSTFQLKNLYYDHTINGVHLIFLSPEQYMTNHQRLGEAAWLSQKQLRCLHRSLLSTPAPTFVFLHQQLDDTVGKTESSRTVLQTSHLKSLVRRHPRVIWFSGHSHITIESPTETVQQDGVHYFGLGSVYEPHDSFDKPNRLKSQSRFVQVYRDRIIIRDRDHAKGEWIGQPHVIRLRKHFPKK